MGGMVAPRQAVYQHRETKWAIQNISIFNFQVPASVRAIYIARHTLQPLPPLFIEH
jgi:hypothetical protein